MAPIDQHKFDFEDWMIKFGYGVSARVSSAEGERSLRKLCAKLNPHAIEYRLNRQLAWRKANEAGEGFGKQITAPSTTLGYASSSIWGKSGLVPVETSGGGKTLDFFGLHKDGESNQVRTSRLIFRG